MTDAPTPPPRVRPRAREVALACTGLLLAIATVAAVPRLLRPLTAPAAYAVAGDDHRVAAAAVVLLAAALPPAAVAVARLARRSRAAWALLAPVVLAGLALMGFLPGRGDGGRAERDLERAAGVQDAGEALTASSLVALVAVLVVVLGGLLLGVALDRRFAPPAPRGRPGPEELRLRAAGEPLPVERAWARRRGVVVGAAQVLVWCGALALAVAVVPG